VAGTLHNVEALFPAGCALIQLVALPLAGRHAASGDLQRLPEERLGFRVGVISDDLGQSAGRRKAGSYRILRAAYGSTPTLLPVPCWVPLP
jgi:hypothetical protein